MHRTRHADCLIVGAGPAGLTAAIYLRRFERHTLVVDQGRSRALAIERTHNWPGVVQGIPGADLLARLRQQLADAQGEVVTAEVTALERRPEGGFVAQWNQQTCHVRTVLLATGVVDVVPALPGIALLQQRGLLRQCPICDGHEHRGERIVVLGDGPHAAREASFLADYSPHVAHAGLNAVPAAAQPGVRRLPALAAGIEVPSGGGVRLRLADGGTHDFDVAYSAIGVRPRSRLGRALGAQADEEGNLIIDEHGATTVEGLFAAGDVVHGLAQLVVASAQGAIAATAIHNRLRNATS